MWYIKDQKTGKYFSTFSTPHFTENKEIRQAFDSERDAIICEENMIHTEIDFLDYDTIPVFEC